MAVIGGLAVLCPSTAPSRGSIAPSWGSTVPNLPDRACLAAEVTH